jgi:hypothetical protein
MNKKGRGFQLFFVVLLLGHSASIGGMVRVRVEDSVRINNKLGIEKGVIKLDFRLPPTEGGLIEDMGRLIRKERRFLRSS